jgi:hypothetical protein
MRNLIARRLAFGFRPVVTGLAILDVIFRTHIAHAREEQDFRAFGTR